MQSASSPRRPAAINVYLAAGFRTAPTFMEGYREAIHALLEEAGWQVRSRLLFPYGDWSRGIVGQLREIRRDIGVPPERSERSVGGRRMLAAIDEDIREAGCLEEDLEKVRDSNSHSHSDANGAKGVEGGAAGTASAEPSKQRSMQRSAQQSARDPARYVLIGHSGGGVAALHAACLLRRREDGKPPYVIMIGSPKCRIPGELRDSVLYLFAGGRKHQGALPLRGSEAAWRHRPADPIARLGTFGGWERTARYGLPVWRSDKHAPSERRPVPIVGGHADYFRGRPPFVSEEGATNLARIVEATRGWLVDRLARPEQP